MDKPKTYNEWHSSLQGFEGLRHANCCKISYEAGQQSRQAELDQAYEDIETFVQAHQRECDIKVQIANELKEKDKRIETVLNLLEYPTAEWSETVFLAIQALRGEHE
ncbi:hypothetical protein [Acinetobacter guillouiae]|uniref:hypothetical protein n=1 Tax=Acinetobacter guillouiae TaxID=106649 RepID=UPI0030089024